MRSHRYEKHHTSCILGQVDHKWSNGVECAHLNPFIDAYGWVGHFRASSWCQNDCGGAPDRDACLHVGAYVCLWGAYGCILGVNAADIHPQNGHPTTHQSLPFDPKCHMQVPGGSNAYDWVLSVSVGSHRCQNSTHFVFDTTSRGGECRRRVECTHLSVVMDTYG